ncbi:unnamed protein product [Linum tenue]|uniref:Transcription factor CBF/NF-Y/archaeal histone domain-containing protein n=1 Tax=Linum tenue TaxID=586396 RepID=A0AAV0KZ35_9ROSI|nr:unnamed protein product [Linum tenue]
MSSADGLQPGSPGGGGSHDSGDQSPRSSNVREQDRFLPIANIGRIMKKALPANGKIAKDAKETVQECVSEFISFVTSEASDKCQREKRKTINGDDLLWAMATLGFEDYIEPLKVYLSRYREVRFLAFSFLLFELMEKLLGLNRVIPKAQARVEIHLLEKMSSPVQMPRFLIKPLSHKVLVTQTLRISVTTGWVIFSLITDKRKDELYVFDM